MTAFFTSGRSTACGLSTRPAAESLAAVPDVARTLDGKLFRLKTHLDRLLRSLAYTRIDCGLGREEVSAIGEETVARNLPLRAENSD